MSATALALISGTNAGAEHGGDVPRSFKAQSIDTKYFAPEAPEHEPVYRMLRQHMVLEKLRDLLTPLRLPHRLLLQTRSCHGIPNAWSDEESVTVCYEYIDEIWKQGADKITPAGITPVDTLIGPLTDVFLHEAGHAVFQALDVPLFGREEDAADQFSAYIMLKFDKEESRRLILGSAYQYKRDLTSPTVTLAQKRFADEHGTSAQRFYNLLCIAYGADPRLFSSVVGQGFLPEERAESCKREYIQVSRAFDRLISPYIDKRLALRLHKRWLTPVATSSKR